MDRSRRTTRQQFGSDNMPPPPPSSSTSVPASSSTPVDEANPSHATASASQVPPSTQIPPPMPPFPPMPQMPPNDPAAMYGMLRDMMGMMQQYQAMMFQQHQYFVQQSNQQAARQNENPTVLEQNNQLKLNDFSKMVPEFDGSSTDPTMAESWIEELEKTFAASATPDDKKVDLAIYMMKKEAYNWWRLASESLQQPVSWITFKNTFFTKYFPNSVRERMIADWLNLRQGSKTIDEYHAEFCRLLRFAGGDYRDERIKVQKFQNGLIEEIQSEVRKFELSTLAETVAKALLVEQIQNDSRARKDKRATFLGKRPASTSFYSGFRGANYQDKGKKPFYGKKEDRKPPFKSSTPVFEKRCLRCFGPHELSDCKWTPGACFTCGQVGHRATECKSPSLPPIFCAYCKQRGHHIANCKDRPDKKSGSNIEKGKVNARVFALQQVEEAPSVDTLAGTLCVANCDAYVLIDTGATHACISEHFMNKCELASELLVDCVMCVNTPLVVETRQPCICRNVNVMISDVSMPIDMLVLPLSDFDVILGMNWLNLYKVTIDCNKAELSFDGKEGRKICLCVGKTKAK